MTEVLGSVRFRLFLAGKVIKDEVAEISEGEQLAELARQHSAYVLKRAVAEGAEWMVEAELLNDPTDPERFIRFGTDAALMHQPLEIDLERHPWSR